MKMQNRGKNDLELGDQTLRKYDRAYLKEKKAETKMTLFFWKCDSLARLWIWTALNNGCQINLSSFWTVSLRIFCHQPISGLVSLHPKMSLFGLDVGHLAGTSTLSMFLPVQKNTLYWHTVCPTSLFNSYAGSDSIIHFLYFILFSAVAV